MLSSSLHREKKLQILLRTPLFFLMHLQVDLVVQQMKLESFVITPISFKWHNAVLPTIILHPTNDILGQGFPSGGVKSSPAWKAIPYLQLSSLAEGVHWWQQEACPQQPCWLQPTTLAGEQATAQPSPWKGEHPAHREGRQWCAGVVRRSTARSCQTKMVSHKEFRSHLQSTWFSICQGRLRSLALSLRALLRQSNGYSGVCWSRAKPNSTQLFYHHRKSNLWREIFPFWFVWFSLERVGPLGSLLFHSSVKKPHFGTSQFFQPRRAGFCSWLAQKWLLKRRMKHSCQELDAQHPVHSWGCRNRS